MLLIIQLAGLLGMSPPGVGYAVQRGEIIARDNDCQLIRYNSSN